MDFFDSFEIESEMRDINFSYEALMAEVGSYNKVTNSVGALASHDCSRGLESFYRQFSLEEESTGAVNGSSAEAPEQTPSSTDESEKKDNSQTSEKKPNWFIRFMKRVGEFFKTIGRAIAGAFKRFWNWLTGLFKKNTEKTTQVVTQATEGTPLTPEVQGVLEEDEAKEVEAIVVEAEVVKKPVKEEEKPVKQNKPAVLALPAPTQEATVTVEEVKKSLGVDNREKLAKIDKVIKNILAKKNDRGFNKCLNHWFAARSVETGAMDKYITGVIEYQNKVDEFVGELMSIEKTDSSQFVRAKRDSKGELSNFEKVDSEPDVKYRDEVVKKVRVPLADGSKHRIYDFNSGFGNYKFLIEHEKAVKLLQSVLQSSDAKTAQSKAIELKNLDNYSVGENFPIKEFIDVIFSMSNNIGKIPETLYNDAIKRSKGQSDTINKKCVNFSNTVSNKIIPKSSDIVEKCYKAQSRFGKAADESRLTPSDTRRIYTGFSIAIDAVKADVNMLQILQKSFGAYAKDISQGTARALAYAKKLKNKYSKTA